jgi:predicted small secreted protein
MKRTRAFLPLVIALASLVVAGCGTTAAGPGLIVPVIGFAGYQWQVVTITHDGKQMPIPAHYDVYLKFVRNGQFGANGPVNYHGGTYRTTSDGFTTGQITMTAAGYGGHDPVTLLAEAALDAIASDVSATATVSGDRLAVTVGGYRLGCRRDGTA